MNIFNCNILLFMAVSFLGFATPAQACKDGGQQYIKVNEYSSALNSEETVTSIRIVTGFWYGDVFITVGESERKITERASCAWITGDGKEVAFASSGGAGRFENEGQTLHIYNVKTRETREILFHYYMIDAVKEAKLESGVTVLLVEMSDGGAADPYFSVVDPKRGEVYFRRLAKLSEVYGDTITLNIYRHGDWDKQFPPTDEPDPKPRSTKTISLKKVLRNNVICKKPDYRAEGRTPC